MTDKVAIIIQEVDAQKYTGLKSVFWVRFPEFGGLKYKVRQKLNGTFEFPGYANEAGKHKEYIWWDKGVNSYILDHLHSKNIRQQNAVFSTYHDMPNIEPEVADWHMLLKIKDGYSGQVRLENKDGLGCDINRVRVMYDSRLRNGKPRGPYILLPSIKVRDGYRSEISLTTVPRKIGAATKRYLLANAEGKWAEEHGGEELFPG